MVAVALEIQVDAAEVTSRRAVLDQQRHRHLWVERLATVTVVVSVTRRMRTAVAAVSAQQEAMREPIQVAVAVKVLLHGLHGALRQESVIT
jgi:hypothetical protein